MIIKQHKGVIMISGKRNNTHNIESEIYYSLVSLNPLFNLFPANE